MSTIVSTASSSPTGLKELVKRHPLIAYFSLAFGGMWITFSPLLLSSLGVITLPDSASLLVFILSSLIGPSLAAYVVTRIMEGREGTRRLFQRCLQWRVGIQWYAVAILSFLFVFLAAYSAIYYGKPLLNLIQNWPLIFSIFLPQILFGLLIPAIGEEPGWRGFALPRLQAQYGPVWGSIILGTLHSLWHLPLFFTPFLGPFTPVGYLAFVVTGISATFIYTWVFNNTRGSILLAMLIHASGNAASKLVGELIPKGIMLTKWLDALINSGWLNSIGFVVMAILIVLMTKGKVSYKPGQPDRM